MVQEFDDPLALMRGVWEHVQDAHKAWLRCTDGPLALAALSRNAAFWCAVWRELCKVYPTEASIASAVKRQA